MFRLILPLALAFAVAVAFFRLPQSAATPAPVADAPGSPSPIKTLGVSSCASMACHHANGPCGSKGSEYSTWIAVDPHAKAYATLFEEESKRIHERLARSDPTLQGLKGAHDNPVCLRCHAMGDCLPPALQTDGVGCERCHGPAEHWKNTHYLKGFDRNTPGFVDLRNNLRVRAEVCMKCHVGDGKQEVNHDLIAAGHPRLRFEFAAYQAIYPRHWCDEDRQVHGPEVELRSWLTGQLVSARSALELLAARADEKREAWPEFAEYDCAACHHSLQKDGFRRGHPGTLPWGTWYYATLPALAEVMPAKKKAMIDALEGLQREMGKPLPSTKEVRKRALAAAALIEDWLTEWRARSRQGREFWRARSRQGREDHGKTGIDVKALMKTLAAQKSQVESGWDGASQVYLGLAALHQARGDMEPGFRKTSPLRIPLFNLRKELAGSFIGGPNARAKYDSPSLYDPGLVIKRLGEVRRQLD